MKHIKIDWEDMDKYIADPLEYRFVDCVEVEGEEAWGKKLASSQDWYFKMHFPNNPVMPGVFLMEALMQTGVFIITTRDEIKEKLMMFHACKSMRMFGSVRPGDVLNTHVVLKSYRNGIACYSGEASVDGTKVCAMEFTLVVPGELERVSPRVDQ